MTVIAGMGTVIEREIPDVGLLRFEDCGPGEWLTQRGEPAKKSRRRYLLGDHELDSVSSIADTLSKPALYRWHEIHGVIGGALAERQGALNGIPQERWIDECYRIGLGASALRDEGADRGKAIHAGMDTLARTGEPPNAADYPEAWRPWLRGCARAWLALDPQLIESEHIVCNPAHGYAGRFDLYAHCHRIRTLIDYKSGKGRVYDAGHFSTRGYAECFEPSMMDPPERIVIVGISDDGQFDPVECAISADEWYDLVRVFRARKRANASMAEQRKARKAVA